MAALDISTHLLAAAAAGSALLHSRIRGRAALESPGRDNLLSIVRRAPGIHMRELQRVTGLGWGQLHYHVGLLCRARALRRDRRGRRVRLYASGAPAAEAEPLPAMAQRLASLLVPEDGKTLAQLACSADISQQLARYHLGRLQERNLARALPGRPRRYVAAQKGGPPEGCGDDGAPLS